MKRTYALIACDIWRRPHFQSMGVSGQLAYLYVRTAPATGRSGVTPLLYDSWAEAMGNGGESIREGVDQMVTAEVAWIDPRTSELFVPDCIRDEDLGRNERVLERAIRDAEVIRSPELVQLVADEFQALATPRAALAAECLRSGAITPPNPKLQNKHRTADREEAKRIRRRFVDCSARTRLRAEIAAGLHVCPCGSSTDLQVDHIVSVARGGGNEHANLQVLCAGCNNRKGAGV